MHRWLLAGFLLLCLVAVGGAVDLSWTDTDDIVAESFTLSPGLVYLSILSPGQVTVSLRDAGDQEIDTGYLTLLEGNGEASKAVRIETAGEYHLSVSGYQEWTVSLTDPPVDEESGLEWTGKGVQSTGFFRLDPGTVRLGLAVQGTGYATLFDDQGRTMGSVVVEEGDSGADVFKEVTIPASGRYLINVAVPSKSGAWTVSVVPNERAKVDLSWTGTGDSETELFELPPGLVYFSLNSAEQVSVQLYNGTGQEVDKGHLILLEGNGDASKAVRIDDEGSFWLTISGNTEWTVSLTDPPVDEEPGLEWTGKGVQSTGLFWLDPGTIRLVLSLDGLGYATLFDEQGNTLGSVVKENGNAGLEYYKEIAIPAGGRYLINVEVPSTSGAWTVSALQIYGPAPTPEVTPAPTAVPAEPAVTAVPRFGMRRYLVGAVPSNPPVGISIRGPEAGTTRAPRQFGTGSTSFSPPKGKFQRWYPATRWRTGR
jgi:hypothetical protein